MSGENKKAQRSSRLRAALLPLAVALAGAIFFALFVVQVWEQIAENAEDSKAAATVNGEPITVRQFRQAALLHRAAVANEFVRSHNAETDGAFWTTSYDGRTPAERLKERTLEHLIRGAVIRQLAREYGLVEDAGYESFRKARAAENERRRETFSKGEVLYGPLQFGEADYETYVLNNLELELEKRWIRNYPEPSEAELISFYEERKDEWFGGGGWGTAAVIHVPYAEDGGKPRTRREALERITEAKTRLDKGEPFEDVAKAYYEPGVLTEYRFTMETREMDLKYDAPLRVAAERLPVGRAGEVIELAGSPLRDAGFYILKVLERVDEAARPFEAVREHAAAAFVKEKFREWLDSQVRNADVEVNGEVYERLLAHGS